MEIDVVMPTWNSNGPGFSQVLKRIVNFTELHNLIIVDKFSNDGTVDVIKKIVPKEKLILIRSRANLAYARYLGIQHVRTPIFAFVDSDVLVPRNWQKILENILMSNKLIGAVSLSLCTRTSRKFRVVKPYNDITAYNILKEGLLHTTRGHAFAVLIRRETVIDWKPRHDLSALETFSLAQHILSKGYLWIELFKPCCIHLKELKYGAGISRYFRQGLWEGAGARLVGIKKRHMLEEVVARLLGGVLTALITHDVKHLANNTALRLGLLLGYLVPYKFRVWRR